MILLPDVRRPLGSTAGTGPLVVRFRVKQTGERQTRRVERMSLDGSGMLLIEQRSCRELLVLDRIEELQIDRIGALRLPD